MNKKPPPNICLIISLIFFSLFRKALSDDDDDLFFKSCSVPKSCGDGLLNISFPFYIQEQQKPYCGYPGFQIYCNNKGNPFLKFQETDYIIHQIFYNNQSLRVSNAAFSGNIFSSSSNSINGCFDIDIPGNLIQNLTLPEGKFELVSDEKKLFLFFDCNLTDSSDIFGDCGRKTVNNSSLGRLALFEDGNNTVFDHASEICGNRVAAPVDEEIGDGGSRSLSEIVNNGFLLKWIASNCSECENSGGICGFVESTFHFKCFCKDRPHSRSCKYGDTKLGVKLGIGIGGPLILLIIISSLFMLWHCYRKKHASPRYVPRNISSRSDLEGGSVYYKVPIFSYSELEKVTGNFDSDKLLGDGGFGTVYYGELPDGREVAVKRLYEHNFRRVEQFMNEIEILTKLQHKNLVALYGCTSRRSRELLLVYEFVPNGTVADNLYGDTVKASSLTWPIRMSIAIETASALAYLHASGIIHRDVKTNNILLDNNFSVKVADFGLSRLFPLDVTHISTAPQGTPGYVDPEYHQCYQLTNKSDVYSFGVVLTELISSMPAVDINRHRHEINLANLAINRIQKCAFNELIDPSLGYESDQEVRRMTTSVAELAFRCLQQDKEMRPAMDEVWEELKRIQTGEYKLDNPDEGHENEVMKSTRPSQSSPEYAEASLLKNNRVPPSPVSVTHKWLSDDTTPNTSAYSPSSA